MDIKLCTKCQNTLATNQFSRCKNTKDLLQKYCKSCNKVSNAKWLQKNLNKNKELCSAWKQNNREKQKILFQKWKENNKEYIKEEAKKWRDKNKDRAKKISKNWRDRNPDNCTARRAKRRATKLNATPLWLSKIHQQKLKSFYREAKQLSLTLKQEIHVDHIIPLQGNIVCGLHVPWNLQLLNKQQNISKKNILPDKKYWLYT